VLICSRGGFSFSLPQKPSDYSFASSSRRAEPSFRRRRPSPGVTASSQLSDCSDEEVEKKCSQHNSTNTDSIAAHTTTATASDSRNDVILSIFMSHSSVGCAVYEFESGLLSLLEDHPIQSRSDLVVQRHVMEEDEDTSQSNDSDDKEQENHSSDFIASSEWGGVKKEPD